MKRKPAFASEADPLTGSEILGSETSASFSLSPEQSRERRRSWRKSDSDFVSDSESSCLGPLFEVLKKSRAGEGELVTIVAGENEDMREAWRECETLGRKWRLFPVKDTVINGETSTYIAREILLSKEGGDLDRESPDLIVAQRKYSPTGTPFLVGHRLLFRGRLDINRPYIFPKLGDEIPGVGCPDIYITFRGIRDWDTVVRGARFAGWDRDVCVEITREDVEGGRKIVLDFEKGKVLDLEVDGKPVTGVMVSCADFKGVYEGLKRGQDASQLYESPQSKKRRMDDGKSEAKAMPNTIELKLIGMGPAIGDEGLKADLNLKLVLKD